jgi:hypothetical protein
MNEPREHKVGDPVAVVIKVEIVARLPDEQCPTCGFDSVAVLLLAGTVDERVAYGPGVYRRCARGCDDHDGIATGIGPS